MLTLINNQDLSRLNRQEQILVTSLRLFTERGYFNTSIHDIQRESKVSIGSIYHYFKNKEGIARALFTGLVASMDEGMDRIDSQYASAHDRCRAVLAWLMELTRRSPAVMQFILYARHREFLPDEKPICSSGPFLKMKEMVKRGMDEGEIRRMDVTVASAALYGGAIRMIHLALDGVLVRPLESYLDDVWSCAWRSVAMGGEGEGRWGAEKAPA
ncbi:TetR/AcrR family transcriptional regulator [Desulfoluna butyratoxydans]|uniref:Tetracycline transcriptional regulator tetr-related c-terminal n=1 Tax=Desulfoluna butyratoxydans TaxID=231438 RepID=A0A4U8YTH1_9BACT|nr:TetR/AcrR family transcriptional regulator [Desulfoluna butyratoxydans]VFQ44623.1 tetracycline transcriptional regulator tetr-related c-terminal [Desulfoluna butyratoxydans]